MSAQQADITITLRSKHAHIFALLIEDMFDGRFVTLHSIPFYGIFFAAMRQNDIHEDEEFQVEFTVTMLLGFFECMEKVLEKCGNKTACRFFDNSVVAMLNAKRLQIRDSMEATRLLDEFNRQTSLHRAFFDNGTDCETSHSETSHSEKSHSEKSHSKKSHSEKSHSEKSHSEKSHEVTSKDSTVWTDVVKKNRPKIVEKPRQESAGRSSVESRSSFAKGTYKFNPGNYLCQGWKGKCLEEPTYALHPPEGDVNKVVYKCTQCAEHAIKTYGWTSAMDLFSKQRTS
jgi:hypothetical protein